MMNKLLEKLKQFFNKFRGVKTLLLTEIDIMEEDEEDIRERKFREELNAREEQELLRLQGKYEEETISEEELTTIEITNLIGLYKRQIQELDMEISLKEAKLNKA